MIDQIKKILCELGISVYLITEQNEESEELYFIKKRLDVKRSKSVYKCTLTVYNDHEKNGTLMRGSANVLLFDGMSALEMKKKISDGYFAAGCVDNPYYDLAAPEADNATNDVPDASLSFIAEGYASAIFKNETDALTFINSAEIFAKKTKTRIVNSRGIDVCFTPYRTDGEVVVASKDGEDVEMFDYFSLVGEKYDELAERVEKDLREVKNRAKAKRELPSGKYDLIVEGVSVREMLGYYLWKANAANVYAKYSDAKPGDSFQSDAAITKLNVTAKATAPYSSEGIKMVDMPLVSDGKLASYFGGARFSHYLGIKPTGEYVKLEMAAGNTALEEMKTAGSLHVVYFSDFQFDPLDGYFGGEIRLGYLCDENGVKVITGGSVSGNIKDVCDTFEFSSETYEDFDYAGPLALKMKNVTVSGTN